MYYQILTAVENGKIRMLPLVIEQSVPWKAWPRHYLTSVDNIEKLTGLDFFAKLDDVVESSLESRVPSRMWPVKFLDSFRALRIHLNERL